MNMLHDARHIARHEAQRAAASVSSEYLTFRLGKEEYGIDILRVQEIRSFEEPTHLANAAGFLLGVINLRGVIVPIVDLRVKFSTDDTGIGPMTVVIVLNVKGRILGAVVDAVSDVMELSAEAIRPAPAMSSAVDTSYITGIASTQERMLILVDIEALMSSADMGLIDSAV
jgi:purine-binding chemotaxis protein CheW